MAIWSSHSNKKSISQSNAKVTSKNTISPYHCVELKMPYDACEEVLKLHGKRFLSADAPVLPLTGCDQNCSCKFKHHNDRRQDDRRDSFSPSGIHFSGDKNRRIGGDRRRSPHSQTHISIG